MARLDRVGANRLLREKLCRQVEERGGRVFYPPLDLCTDNGAMIAFAAALRIEADPGLLTAQNSSFNIRPRWPLQTLPEAALLRG